MSWIVRNVAPLGIAATAYALAVSLPASDPDMYWHLASGRWMVEHRELLREDVFSFTARGEPYRVGEWLGQVILWLAYDTGSWRGIAVLRGLLVALGAFFLGRAALRTGAPWPVAIPIVLFALTLSQQSWGDRPQLFTIALFPVALDLLFVARAGDRRALVALAPLLLLWTNLHGGYALGLALLVIFTAEAAVARRGDARAFALASVAGFAATLIDPGALGPLGAVTHVATPPRFIVEELPPDVLRPNGFLFSLFVLATLVAAVLSGGTLLEALLLAPLLWLALSAQRHLPYFAFAATPFLAAKAGQLWRARYGVRPRMRPLPAGGQVALALALLAGGALSTTVAAAEPDERSYPAAALAALRTGGGNLLHEYDWGGWLIFRAPERPVFVDGRLFLFMPDVVDDWVEATSLRPRWREVLERHAIREVLLRPQQPLAVALRHLGWRVRSEDAGYVLLARP